jgi:hypothetical protein
MITSSFIQIGSKTNMVFNVAQISYLQAENVTITDLNRSSYDGYPRSAEKAFSIFLYMTTRRSMELIYDSEAIRDAMFEKILATLNPLVIAKPELVREAEEKQAPTEGE